MEFSAQIPALPEFLARLQEAPEVAAPILQRAIVQSSLVLAKNTNASTVPIRTGFLVNHFQWVLGDFKGWWYPTASYASMVEFGTKPHVIYPKEKKALYWPGADHPVRSVNHPGTKANPYMERILDASQDEISEKFSDALQAIIEAINA